MGASNAGFTVRLSSACLIVSIQGNLSCAVIDKMREEVLVKLQQVCVKALVVDLSAVTILDNKEFNSLCKAMLMAGLMGAKPIIAGINYAVASALVESASQFKGIIHVHSLDQAVASIE